jgi:NADPH:quinone reductase-like Zn-dependent oxidoreductase
LGGHIRSNRAAGAELLERLIARAASGRISPRADKLYTLAEAPQALAALMSRKSVGKPVVLPQR